jgi:hypothetical protein
VPGSNHIDKARILETWPQSAGFDEARSVDAVKA